MRYRTDEEVKVRNQIQDELQMAIDDKDKLRLRIILNRVHRMNDWEVQLGYKGKSEIDSTFYMSDDKCIAVKEKGQHIFEIYKNRQHEGTWLIYNPFELMTVEEEEAYDRAESDWEQEAEQAMNNYYEGRAKGYMFDDPRGQ